MLRPATKAALPPGIVWDYAEIPRMDSFRFNRPELKVSRFTYGIIKCEELSKEECDKYDLREVWLHDGGFIETDPDNYKRSEMLRLTPFDVQYLQTVLRSHETEAPEAGMHDNLLYLLSQLKQPI
jgi:hypothetical protein